MGDQKHEQTVASLALAEQIFAGEAEMASLIRTTDWSKTPLGPIETWPQSKEAKLSYSAHALIENRNGLLVDFQMDEADGRAERRNALEMLDESVPGTSRVTVGGDKGYDTRDFVEACRERSVTPHGRAERPQASSHGGEGLLAAEGLRQGLRRMGAARLADELQAALGALPGGHHAATHDRRQAQIDALDPRAQVLERFDKALYATEPHLINLMAAFARRHLARPS
jgi:hypothetical protein